MFTSLVSGMHCLPSSEAKPDQEPTCMVRKVFCRLSNIPLARSQPPG